MAEYIKKSDVRSVLERATCMYPLSFISGISTAWKEIANMPAADVVEVRHGEWVVCDTFDDLITCSVCKSNKYPFGYGFTYCPECGAKMDGRREK